MCNITNISFQLWISQDEIVNLDTSQKVRTVSPVNEGDMTIEDVTTDTPRPDVIATDVTPVKPPPGLFRPIEYPPLHIFVCTGTCI